MRKPAGALTSGQTAAVGHGRAGASHMLKHVVPTTALALPPFQKKGKSGNYIFNPMNRLMETVFVGGGFPPFRGLGEGFKCL